MNNRKKLSLAIGILFVVIVVVIGIYVNQTFIQSGKITPSTAPLSTTPTQPPYTENPLQTLITTYGGALPAGVTEQISFFKNTGKSVDGKFLLKDTFGGTNKNPLIIDGTFVMITDNTGTMFIATPKSGDLMYFRVLDAKTIEKLGSSKRELPGKPTLTKQ